MYIRESSVRIGNLSRVFSMQRRIRAAGAPRPDRTLCNLQKSAKTDSTIWRLRLGSRFWERNHSRSPPRSRGTAVKRRLARLEAAGPVMNFSRNAWH